ncbi:hypothetical protein J7394_00030 [Ruegeria sp. R13_0]|uniref:hypothetical protein n=1 Tax=Ruegeria sp. R13_0 TaxID=2821099 RepID=UPI001ADC69F6|nr:hypothetical protein [Ruegeria sp. R13_0]MBO9432571.1 hypothetical protein [Ruegeria sp. R13_0]
MSKAKQSKELTEANDRTVKTKDLPKVGVAFGGSNSEGQVVSHSEGALNKIFGTDDDNLAAALTQQSLKVLGKWEAGDGPQGNDERDFMMSIISDLGPQDAIERMLAVQLAATHIATIRQAGWLAGSENQMQLDGRGNGYNKLARTFAAQVETLRKHRNGGKQTVTVQHVNVEDGGQAIVGNVETGGSKK